MISEKTSRLKFLVKEGSILVSIGRDFKGLPLPTSGYSDLKTGLGVFTPDKVIEIEATHLLNIHIDETMAVIGDDGKHYIEVVNGSSVIYEATEILKAIANNDGKYICIGKVIGDASLPITGFEDLAGTAYSPLMNIEFEALQESSILADFKDLVISSNGDVFARATLINN